MGPEYKNGNVISRCPDCNGAVSTYEYKGASSGEYGTIVVDENHLYNDINYGRVIYKLYKCAGCGRGGMAKLHLNGALHEGKMEWFFPISIDSAQIPDDVPHGIVQEYREAEICAANNAWRGASGLLRSTLEKVLKENGYKNGNLASKIDAAASDGIITESRKKKAHDDIRVLGNDVLHDEWRKISPEDVAASHRYVQRIIEDFYDDRESVVKILKDKKRIE